MKSKKINILAILMWLSLSLAIVTADRLTKDYIVTHWALGDLHRIHPYLNLVRAHNNGAAYGLLSQANGWQSLLFITIAVVVVGSFLCWLTQLPARAHGTAAGLALILGGAIGNLWDRLTCRYVIDFIDIHLKGWHPFGVFNVADIAITCGAAILISVALFERE